MLDALRLCPECAGRDSEDCERCRGAGEIREFPAHVGRLVREAVAVAAKNSAREQSNALADRIGRSVIRELVAFLATNRAPDEPER